MGRQSGLTGDEAYAILHKKIEAGGSGAGGTSNYNDLSNKPKINGVEVSGDKTSDDYGVVSKGQGPENSGKILRVNESGEVLPSDEPEISVVEHVIFLSRPEVETT